MTALAGELFSVLVVVVHVEAVVVVPLVGSVQVEVLKMQ